MAAIQVPFETKVVRVQHIYCSLIDELRDIYVKIQHSYQLVEHYFVVCVEKSAYTAGLLNMRCTEARF